MKQLFLTIVLMAAIGYISPAVAQTENVGILSDIQSVADKQALKELVDKFSILADRKDAQAQTELFTNDAVVESYLDGKLISSLKGREEIGAAFADFLVRFDTVYHINGQQVVSINDDKATGIAYCQVVLIGTDKNGKRMMTMQGVSYDDEYLCSNGRWLIAKRTSHFVWSDNREIKQQTLEQ